MGVSISSSGSMLIESKTIIYQLKNISDKCNRLRIDWNNSQRFDQRSGGCWIKKQCRFQRCYKEIHHW